jgi:hypothetical protein
VYGFNRCVWYRERGVRVILCWIRVIALYIYTHTYLHIYTHKYIHIHTHIHTLVHPHSFMAMVNSYIHTHTYIHTYIHTAL